MDNIKVLKDHCSDLCRELDANKTVMSHYQKNILREKIKALTAAIELMQNEDRMIEVVESHIEAYSAADECLVSAPTALRFLLTKLRSIAGE